MLGLQQPWECEDLNKAFNMSNKIPSQINMSKTLISSNKILMSTALNKTVKGIRKRGKKISIILT